MPERMTAAYITAHGRRSRYGSASRGSRSHGGLRPGETIYVGGAAGNVGSVAVVLARRASAQELARAAGLIGELAADGLLAPRIADDLPLAQ
jgi:NADPH:quinone reductase-like Zn-dependent oxidoreductase